MIKQIQLRGISRSPSDRMTEDGGCAESLNVQLEQHELAPMLTPQEVSRYVSSTAPLPGKALYIHKGNGYENVICLENGTGVETDSIVARVVKPAEIGNQTIYEFEEGETLKDITSIGNTIIISTSKRMWYVVRVNRNGDEYMELGDKIPEPNVSFRTKMYKTYGYDVWREGDVYVGETGEELNAEDVPEDDLRNFDTQAWENYLNGTLTGVEADASANYINTKVWEVISRQINAVKKQGYFCTPIFARYALKLFDGEYIYQSVPVLIGAGEYEFMKAIGVPEINTYHAHIYAILTNAFKATAHIFLYPQNQFEGWEDIIESIDIFLSEDIHVPIFNDKITAVTSGGIGGSEKLSFINQDVETYKEDVRNEILSKTIFYKLKSFKLANLTQLESGYDMMSNRNFVSQDFLKVQDRLTDGYLNFHRKIADNMMTYNKRLILSGLSYEITPGFSSLNGDTVKKYQVDSRSGERYIFKYYLRDSGGNILTVYARNDSPGDVTYQGDLTIFNFSYEFGLETKSSIPYGWISYPDARCFKVQIEKRVPNGPTPLDYVSYYKEYEMEAHPGLNCAFAFIGLSNEIVPSESTEVPEGFDPFGRVENRVYSENNTLWASVMGNPFLFEASGKETFNAEVIAMSPVTTPLSEGQVGFADMYVFTNEGIWALPVNKEGTFTNHVDVSGDVAISKDSIVPLEQSVVFVSKQGVMLLKGQQVVCLSEFMNGEHYVSPLPVIRILDDNQAVPGIRDAYQDNMRFGEFIEGCKISYDYVDKRLIFFRADRSYQYVYRLESKTWHKMSVENLGITLAGRINSYPDCYIYATKTLGQNVEHLLYDFSVERTSNPNQSVLPGLIITRQIDLGAADVRKALVDIRLRGQMSKSHVKYILLGSMDGLSWRILSSLRGGSYKRFRLVLVSSLTANERLSWIDMQYDERFTNRLR